MLLNASFMWSETSCSGYRRERVRLGQTTEGIQISCLHGIIFIATSFLLPLCPQPTPLSWPALISQMKNNLKHFLKLFMDVEFSYSSCLVRLIPKVSHGCLHFLTSVNFSFIYAMSGHWHLDSGDAGTFATSF